MVAPERFVNFDIGQPQALRDAVNSVMGASGPNHAAGLVPDPGSTPGTTKFLREDASFQVPPAPSIATTSVAGIVKPDGTTITVAGDGTIAAVTPSFSVPTIQRFTSGIAQTYTPPAGLKYIHVRICAGGGGGGAQATNAGANGADTSFGAWTAIHGNGGLAGGAGVNGGLGGTGGVNGTGALIFRVDGGTGGIGSPTLIGEGGGANPFGGAGAVRVGPATGGSAAANSGGGGAGGGGATGSAGGAGEYVEFIMTAAQVGASQTYTVGPGGNGGAAGTSAGGNGAAGQIIVEEFYV